MSLLSMPGPPFGFIAGAGLDFFGFRELFQRHQVVTFRDMGIAGNDSEVGEQLSLGTIVFTSRHGVRIHALPYRREQKHSQSPTPDAGSVGDG